MYTPEEIKIDTRGEWVGKVYNKDEFAELLIQAANESVRFARTLCPTTTMPERILFLIGGNDGRRKLDRSANQLIVPVSCVYDVEQAVAILLREDGWHRDQIHLGVSATSQDTTFIDVFWSIYGWTNMVLLGHPRFQNPPFIVSGPQLEDYDYSTGKGCPTVYRLETI